MNTDRMKILEMMKSGQITAEEADALLEKLASLDAEEPEPVEIDQPFVEAHTRGVREIVADALKSAAAAGRSASATIRTVRERHSQKARGRALAIKVNTNDGDNVNVRVPLALIKAGVKLSALLPESASKAMNEQGVHVEEFAKMTGEELADALEELNINIETEEGDKVTICCE